MSPIYNVSLFVDWHLFYPVTLYRISRAPKSRPPQQFVHKKPPHLVPVVPVLPVKKPRDTPDSERKEKKRWTFFENFWRNPSKYSRGKGSFGEKERKIWLLLIVPLFAGSEFIGKWRMKLKSPIDPCKVTIPCFWWWPRAGVTCSRAKSTQPLTLNYTIWLDTINSAASMQNRIM